MGLDQGWNGDRRAEPDLPARRAGGGGLSRRRGPTHLPGLVDSHAHLQHDRFDEDRDAVIERAGEAGIESILVPGWDLPSSHAALELAERHPQTIVAAVGVHPHDAGSMDEAGWRELESLVADPRARAVGEIGLDYFRNLSPPPVQRAAFDRQLDLARTHGRPVLVHDRDAHDDIVAVLTAWAAAVASGSERLLGVLHAFSGDAAMAMRLGNSGFLVSFALPVAFRSAVGPRGAATAVADDAFLVETDAPYLGPARDRRNEPTTVLRVVAELARLRGAEPSTLVPGMQSAWKRLLS